MPTTVMLEGRPLRGLTLDAMGCLVVLRDPVPALGELLAGGGVPRPAAVIQTALRQEIVYYKAHHDEGRDPGSLRALQRASARVFLDALDPPDAGGGATVAEVSSRGTGHRSEGAPAASPRRASAPGAVDDVFLDGFLDALEFAVLPGVIDALEALRAAGLALVCVSNWDSGLADHLERLGLTPYLEAVVTSAAVGASKPDPRIFTAALERLGLPATAVAHLGDEAADRDGAAAAGLRFLEPPVADLPERLGIVR